MNKMIHIKPGTGINEILFGITKTELENVLGTPSKKYTDEYECEFFCYHDLGCGFKFEIKNQNLLGWIEISNPNSQLFGQSIIGQTIDKILPILKQKLGSNIDHSDYGSWRSITFDDHWLEINETHGFISSVNIGVLYTKNDQVIWPKREIENRRTNGSN